MLLDRCTVSQLRGCYAQGKKTSEIDDFMDLLLGKHSDVLFNACLYALEGNAGQLPSRQQMADQLAEANQFVRAALGDVRVVEESDHVIKGLFGHHSDTSARFLREDEFLQTAAPLIASPVSRKKVPHVVSSLIDLAIRCEIDTRSLTCIAALSCVMVRNGATPAKRLLKVRNPYRASDRYNAHSDIRALEFMMSCFCLFGGEKGMMLTADKDLALFWAALNAYDFTWTSGPSFKVSPVEELLPIHLFPEVRQMLERSGFDFTPADVPPSGGGGGES